MSQIAVLLLLAGFASRGGRATVTYQPTPLEGQGCPSDEDKAQVIENFHVLIEDRVETEGTPETRLLAELNTAVEAMSQEVAELSNNVTQQNVDLAELNAAVETLGQNLSELSSNVTQQSADLETKILQVIDEPAVISQALPAESCQQIFGNKPDLPSGYYWIKASDGAAVQVYCETARQCCSETTGVRTRVAYLDMTDPNQQCPPAWTLIELPRRTCGRTNPSALSCDPVIFPTHGITYSRVCGRVKAYQVGQTDAFFVFNSLFEPLATVNCSYVNGVSITRGNNPKQHVWTFAAARSEQLNADNICPCTNPNGADIQIPPFVGHDYFCDTGADTEPSQGQFFTDDPLWDGEGCGPTSTCCELNSPPWFCKQLPAPTSDNIEVRLCFVTLGLESDNIAVEQLELYIF